MKKKILHTGDCLQVLKLYKTNFFNLIITSPPYANQRKNTYGGVKPENYVNWFIPRAKEFIRVLKPDGTFILNIKENVVNKERSTYVLELILALKKQGWFWTEEFMWHKKNSPPGKWPNRFRDNWERLLQFNKTTNFKMYQEAVMIPIDETLKQKGKNLNEKDFIRKENKTNSGFGIKISNWAGREMSYPNNVLHLAPESSNKGHSAAFPNKLPEWFIKLFTKQGDWVLDPFVGSGTTSFVSRNLNRNSVGIDKIKVEIPLAEKMRLF